MTQSYEMAASYLAALGTEQVQEFRAIHDQLKDIPARPRRGTLAECWQWLVEQNNQGYGIFVTPSIMDGVGRMLENVAYCRANYADLDGIDAPQQLARASEFNPLPWFCVNSSPNKYHVYWPVQAYVGNERFELVQRKLRQLFNGDKNVIDPTRVMRLPGFYHLKGEPHLVTCHALQGYGVPLTVEHLEAATAGVLVIDGGIGTRHELGDPELAAPSLEWLQRALDLVDPNALDRYEWIALTSGIKQAGWSLASPETLYEMWARWCARYDKNDEGENLKQWDSIRNTELGWHSVVRRVPTLQAFMSFGEKKRSTAVANTPSDVPEMPGPQPLDCSGEFLTHLEQAEWFKGCTYVINLGLIMDADGRFLNSNQFNAKYGGKLFIVTSGGKTSNEAWQAATRGTLFQIPKVDHIRFLPSKPHGEWITDDMGRIGINTYKPAHIERAPGDVTPFLRHIAMLLPDPIDQRILLDYLAHNIKYPGHKIPWSFVIQSAEGAGKGVIKRIITHCIGQSYVYFPNAKELTASGSQFNGWMRNKLFILADEIKVDDRRDLIEVLKPMISEFRIEVQSKGVDQQLEDNFANWGFFTNYKDAVPVNKNGRRFAIFFSPIQTAQDLLDRQMGEHYFKCLYDWLDAGGAAAVAEWFMTHYQIERGAIPMRAPKTTSWDEAVIAGRSPLERCIAEGIDDGLDGFKNGWVSSLAVLRKVKADGALVRTPSLDAIGRCLAEMGYKDCGRAPRPWFQESAEVRATVFYCNGYADPAGYGPAQGYV